MIIQRQDEKTIVFRIKNTLFRRFHHNAQWQQLTAYGWENIPGQQLEESFPYHKLGDLLQAYITQSPDTCQHPIKDVVITQTYTQCLLCGTML